MLFRNISLLVSLTFISVIAGRASAQVAEFAVQSTGGSRVSFESDAPLETISGITSSVTGSISIDPANLAATRGTVTVPVSSIRTGVDLRDEHLQSENWLDAARFPNATFEITGVTGATVLAEGDNRLRISGRFTIHGQTVNVTADARVTYRAPSGAEPALIRVRTRFSVQLPRHGVSVPTLVRLKVSDEIAVRIALRLHPA